MHGFYANAKTVEIAHCWVRKMFYVTLLHFTTLESTHVVRILTYTQNSEWVLRSFLQNSDLLLTVYSHVILGAISQNLSVRRSADLGFLTYTVIKRESQSCREGHPRSRLSEQAPCMVLLCSQPLRTSLCLISMYCRQGDHAPLASPFGSSSLCTQGKKSASSVGYGVPVITTRTFFRLTSPNTQRSEGRICSFLWKALVKMPCVRWDCSKPPPHT